ncbi:MAG: sugar ABC transporter permease [Nocardioidaceae bacterium]|nr:sugar ABC transporter permease [Nocardioidaceae bacterium]NUS52939.1 sugar ABC transporter permease [Nocardioidaceae bacterium]
MSTTSVTDPPRTDDRAKPRRPHRRVSPQARARRRREAVAGWLFLLPDALGLLVFVGLPMVLAFVVALYKVDGFGGYTFAGLDNYRTMLHDTQFWSSLKVTGIYVVATVPLTFAVGLGLALLVRDRFPGVGWVRSAFFLPNVISLVVVGLIWQFLLVDKRGAAARLLEPLGLGNLSFLGSPKLALGTYVVISVWFLMGYVMLVFLAGLQDIPRELEDAALVDGAGRWQRFTNVTWPLLRPTSFFVLVWTTVGSVTGLQAFDLVFVLTKGGPANATSTVVFYIYEQAFTFSNLGYASAMTTLVVLLLVLATGVMFATTRGGRFDEE